MRFAAAPVGRDCGVGVRVSGSCRASSSWSSSPRCSLGRDCGFGVRGCSACGVSGSWSSSSCRSSEGFGRLGHSLEGSNAGALVDSTLPLEAQTSAWKDCSSSSCPALDACPRRDCGVAASSLRVAVRRSPCGDGRTFPSSVRVPVSPETPRCRDCGFGASGLPLPCLLEGGSVLSVLETCPSSLRGLPSLATSECDCVALALPLVSWLRASPRGPWSERGCPLHGLRRIRPRRTTRC